MNLKKSANDMFNEIGFVRSDCRDEILYEKKEIGLKLFINPRTINKEKNICLHIYNEIEGMLCGLTAKELRAICKLLDELEENN